MKLLKYFFFVNILSLIIIIFFLLRENSYKQKVDNGLVKGAITSPIQLVTPTIYNVTSTPSPTLMPTSTPSIALKKSSYTIALFGDSMIDTMGENLEYLQKVLINTYPKTKFNLYNYGIGGQNVEEGLSRFESTFVNRERHFPPLPALSPDILIIGSFAYNPFPSHDKNKHYTLLTELVKKAKNITSNVYILAEIAPLKNGFGKGKNGVNWPQDLSYKHALRIIEQLDNAVNVSSSQNIPLINAYYVSRIDGTFGDPYYVNIDEGIHPSAAGHSLMAQLIVKKVKFD